MKKRGVLVVCWVLFLVSMVALLDVLRAPTWFCVLVAMGESVLFVVAMASH